MKDRIEVALRIIIILYFTAAIIYTNLRINGIQDLALLQGANLNGIIDVVGHIVDKEYKK